MIFRHAVAKIRARVDGNGNGTMSIEVERFGTRDEYAVDPAGGESGTSYTFLRNVELTAYYFIYHPDLIPRNESARIRRLANDQGGFRLYLNGFRVLPYGEKNNDWLGLDEESRKRSILPGIANINWFGAIEVPDRDHRFFSEVSSREGLNKNFAYDELVTFAREVAISAALRTATIRERKQTAGQKRQEEHTADPLMPETLRTIADKIDRVIESGKQHHIPLFDDSSANSGSTSSADSANISTQALLESAAKTFRVAATRTESLMHELEMLRVLSSLGLMIGMFTHEARTKLISIRSGIEALGLELPVGTKSNARVTDLSLQAKLLQAYLSYFDSSISANVQREVSPQDVSQLLYSFIEQFTPIATQSAISIVSDIDEDLTSAPMHESEWASILGNLLSNSLKAIRRSKTEFGKIYISAQQIGGNIVVEFSDNGDGIPRENRDHIFEAFFTTTNISLDDDDLTGMGLGLKVVRDIIDSRGGEIYVSDAPEGYSTCMRIEIPYHVGEEN